MLVPPELLHIFPGLPLCCAINTICFLPSTAIHLSLLLFFFFFTWGPREVVVWLVVVVAVFLALRVMVVVGQRRRLPLGRRDFGAVISFCIFVADPLLGFLFRL